MLRNITEDEIREAFSDETFSKRVKYFEGEYVETGVKKENSLMGTVIGSAPRPYKVRSRR